MKLRRRFGVTLIAIVAALPLIAYAVEQLVPLSYIASTFAPELHAEQSALIVARIEEFSKKIAARADSARAESVNREVTAFTAGGSVVLPELAEFVIVRGDVSIRVTSGTVVNLTTGAAIAGDALAHVANRYLTVEASGVELLVYSASAEIMLPHGAKLTASGTIPSDRIFLDVPETHWASAYVAAAYERGIVNGVGGYKFDPDGAVTRAAFVTMLGRLANAPVDGLSRFSDVAADAWYAPYVAWAAENGIVNGTAPDSFSPDAEITREQITALLYRYAGSPATESASEFTDAESISDYAVDAVEWAQASGLIAGYEDGSFAPKQGASRAEVAAIITRLIE
ncbi:MAG: S-layer homology domain-containing protein [Oscillospiraceae bacterium]|jgi:hypothetical protein|nr:S-layer homology domain-containing protein [Oscillospiraceae bacterium]